MFDCLANVFQGKWRWEQISNDDILWEGRPWQGFGCGTVKKIISPIRNKIKP